MRSKHMYLWLHFLSTITKENCKRIFLRPSFLNCHDVATRQLFLITWHYPAGCFINLYNKHYFQRTIPGVLNFWLFQRTLVTDAFWPWCIKLYGILKIYKIVFFFFFFFFNIKPPGHYLLKHQLRIFFQLLSGEPCWFW